MAGRDSTGRAKSRQEDKTEETSRKYKTGRDSRKRQCWEIEPKETTRKDNPPEKEITGRDWKRQPAGKDGRLEEIRLEVTTKRDNQPEEDTTGRDSGKTRQKRQDW